MREILFRGKRIDNSEWVEGFLVMKADPLLGIMASFILKQEVDANGILCSNMAWYKVDPETVGQFTGLTNGMKIFEGDIGRYKQTDGAKRNGNPIICMGKVVYNTKNASYAVESKDEVGCKYFDYFPIKDFEITR